VSIAGDKDNSARGRSSEGAEKTIEIIVSEVGELTIVLRPALPFEADGYRLQENSIEIFGQGEKVNLPIPEDLIEEVREIDQAILFEYDRTSAEPVRETDILKL
jgi:hypothetical protein